MLENSPSDTELQSTSEKTGEFPVFSYSRRYFLFILSTTGW